MSWDISLFIVVTLPYVYGLDKIIGLVCSNLPINSSSNFMHGLLVHMNTTSCLPKCFPNFITLSKRFMLRAFGFTTVSIASSMDSIDETFFGRETLLKIFSNNKECQNK